jgi:hypothetical protein
MIKSRFLATVALGTITSILTLAVQPAQAKLTVGTVTVSKRINAAPSVPSPMVVDPDRLFRNELQPVLSADESNGIPDCIYKGRCGTIAIDAEHGCG